jgi:hypothetical protein
MSRIKWDEQEAYTETETRLDTLLQLLRSGRWPDDDLEALLGKADRVMEWLYSKRKAPDLRPLAGARK